MFSVFVLVLQDKVLELYFPVCVYLECFEINVEDSFRRYQGNVKTNKREISESYLFGKTIRKKRK